MLENLTRHVDTDDNPDLVACGALRFSGRQATHDMGAVKERNLRHRTGYSHPGNREIRESQ